MSDVFHRLYRAHTVKVHTATSVDVDLDLTMGVKLLRTVAVEGVTTNLTRGLWREATHCMVFLVGGHDLFVYADERNRDTPMIGRIYVPGFCPVNPPVPLEVPPGQTSPCVEVSSWMRWASDFGFDAPRLRAALKG